MSQSPPATSTSTNSDPIPPSPKPKSGRGRRWLRIGLWVLFIDLMVAMVFEGVNLRRYAWDFTQPVRYLYDIQRNYDFGDQATKSGFLNIYEDQAAAAAAGKLDEAHRLNYTPMRLAVFEAWAAWTHHAWPDAKGWQGRYDFNATIMRFNTTLELASALAAFLLVRHWIRRSWQPRRPWPASQTMPRPGPCAGAGIFRATLAFILVWFSPAMMISAHGWPSWDSWVVPFFLWAVLLCCWDMWFIAGVVLGVGAMFKGQQLFVAAMFILWPLFAGQYRSALKWACGFLLAFGGIAAGWMLSTRPDLASPLRQINWPALCWVGSSAICLVIVGLVSMLKNRRRWLRLLVTAAAFIAMTWPLTRWPYGVAANAAMLAAAAIAVALAWRLSWRCRLQLIGGVVGASLLLCIVFFHAGTAWWQIGFMYGTERHPAMIVGAGNNLCALLQSRFGLSNVHEVVWTIPASCVAGWPHAAIDIELRHLMLLIYVALFIPACAAIAMQWRRNDRHFLVAMAAPWILFYTIPAQIHERYLLFAAGAAACAVGASLGLGLLDVFFALLAAAQTADMMMITRGIGQGGMDMPHPIFNRTFELFLSHVRPDISWAVVLACVAWLYLSFTRYRKPAPAQLPAQLPA